MKSLRAGGLALATVIGLIWAPAAFAQEGTTEPTTTDTTTTESTAEPAPDPWAETPRTRDLKRRAVWSKLVARKLSKLTHHPRPTVSRTKADFDSLLRYRLWLRDAWRIRAARARHRAHHPPHLTEWRCIHRWEGSWTDPNSPYYGGLQMDLDRKEVKRAGIPINLTAKEFQLLEYLLRNKNRVVSRADIAINVWDIDFDTKTNVIDVYVNFLRKKLDRDFEQKLIHTQVGVGYILKDSQR